MTTLLRDADASDLGAITDIYRHAVESGVASYELKPPSLGEMTDRFAALTEKRYPYIVAQSQDGTLLGYAYAGPYRPRPAYRWTVEDSIYLAPSAQGQGVGRTLLTKLISRSTVLGFRQMVAVIGGSEPASVRLHEALGFVMVGTIQGTGHKHGRWLDTVLMQLALGDGKQMAPDPDVYPGSLHES